MKKRAKRVSSSEDELSSGGEPSSPIKTTRRARTNVKYVVDDHDDDHDDDVEQGPGDDGHDWMEVDDDDSDSDFE